MTVTQAIGLGVLLSGGGTTLENFFAKIDAGELPAEVKVVVSSRADAYGLVRAKNHSVDHYVVPSKNYRRVGEPTDWVGMSAEVCKILDRYEVDLVVLAGFMCQFVIPPRYHGRVMNIHPGLIPAFCGPGIYGHRVHEAVLEYGAKVAGCTVHFADQKYDHGPIIVQRTVPVLDDDTPETLAKRVFAQECIAYPEAVRLFAEGRLKIEGRRTRILAPKDTRETP